MRIYIYAQGTGDYTRSEDALKEKGVSFPQPPTFIIGYVAMCVCVCVSVSVSARVHRCVCAAAFAAHASYDLFKI